MKIRGSLTALLITAIAVVALRIYHLTSAVEYSTGMNIEGKLTNYAVPALIVLAIIIMFSMALGKREHPERFADESSPFAGIVTLLTGLLIGVDSALQLFNSANRIFEGTAGIIFAGLGITVLMAMIFVAISFFKGENTVSGTPLIMLFPIVWAGMRLALTFLHFSSVANIGENSYDVVMMAFTMLFFVFFSKFMISGGSDNGKWAFATGCPAALAAFASFIPRLVLQLIISDSNSDKYTMSVRTDTAFDPQYIDLALGVFIVAALFAISKKEKEAVLPEGIRLGTYAPQPQQYAAAPVAGSMGASPVRRQPAQVPVQNPAARPAQRPAQAAQQRIPGAQQMRPGMNPAAPGMNGMQRAGMPMQGMIMTPYGMMMNPYAMQGMNGMPVQGMNGMMMNPYAMQGMNGMPMQGMPGMPGMPAQGMNGQMGMPQTTLLQGGGADNFTQKGAGLRVADSFHVRSNYTGHGKKFSGLDDFRSGMLSGRRAFDDIEEDEETTENADGAAMLEAQNAELAQLQQSVDDSLGGMAGHGEDISQPATSVEVETADDDGGYPDAPEAEAPEARTTRDIRLGSGGGRLADRLEEQRRAREQAAYESYDESDEYEDEYEEYETDEEYEDMEYGAAGYDYEYSNGYNEHGGQRFASYYGGGYEDDGEYEDEYDEYDDEYDGEYDDDYDGEYDDEYDDYDDDEEYYGDE